MENNLAQQLQKKVRTQFFYRLDALPAAQTNSVKALKTSGNLA